MEECARILVPVDGSPEAEEGAAFAGTLAESIGADIDLLYVAGFPMETDSFEDSWLPESVSGSVAKAADEIFAGARRRIAASVTVGFAERTGLPAEEILRYARARGSRYIVFGVKQRDSALNFLLGSVRRAILETAPCAVTVVKWSPEGG